MFLKRALRLILCVAALAFTGCGGGGTDLVGDLSLDASAKDLTSGFFQVDAIATYTNPSKDTLGTEINFTFTFINGNNVSSVSQTEKVSSSGKIGFSSPPISQSTTPIFVDVQASTGDLKQFKRVTIPAIAGLSVTPSAVAFAATDQIGTTKTVTVSGGVTPYNASSSNPNIAASVTGGTVTLTLNNRTAAAGTDTANITITDSQARSVAVAVSF